jgi:malonyl-CoA O-methyltransferase
MSGAAQPAVLQPIDAFRLWAPSYDTSPNPLLALEERSLLSSLSSVADRDALDMGCGSGRWLPLIEAASARSVVGIDASPEMLQLAAARCAPATRLICTDCTHTPLAPASIDWVLGSFLISYVADLNRFAREAARICRPGAGVMLTDVHPHTRALGWKRSFRASEQIFEIEVNAYEIADLHGAMKSAGFALTRFEEFSFGAPEFAIFHAAGRPDLYKNVENTPVIFAAEYRRSGR